MKTLFKEPVLPLLPNRVRRNYAGGALLSDWERSARQLAASQPWIESVPAPADGNCADDERPEDWLASTTEAVNTGMKPVPQEGIGRVVAPQSGEICYLDALFVAEGEYYLGADHLRQRGPQLGFLAKLLDSSMRLHTQVHPTRSFAREHLGSPWGKLECYVILGKRPGYAADLRLGFQHPPSRNEWRRIVETQDTDAMDACFEPVPVGVGEVWLVPGGFVHALGAGLLLLEVMEPSDLAVRCEFEREGIVVPEGARFMGKDLEFCLDVFDYSQLPVDQAAVRCRMEPQVLQQGAWGSEVCRLPLAQTGCFEVVGLTLNDRFDWQPQTRCRLLLVGSGRGLLHVGGRTFNLYPGARFLVAASAPQIRIEPATGSGPLELWYCKPG